MRLPSFRRRRAEAPAAAPTRPAVGEPQVIQVDPGQLREMSAVFAAPRWLRDLGIASWLLLGAALLLVGLVWLLALTQVIVGPVIVGLVLATVAGPLVTWLERRRVPRAAGAGIVLLALLALGAVIVLMVVGGLVAQADEIESAAGAGMDKVQSWLEDSGVDDNGAAETSTSVSADTSATVSTFVHGLSSAVAGITSLVFFCVFSTFSTFFLLKDGPRFRSWVDRHMGVPLDVAQTITQNVITALRRYFGGVTIVAAFNAVVVGVGAYLLDVPLAGTIAVVTFVLAYIPFIGAFVSGAFAVLLALGSEGTETALIMLVIVILANGLLQNIVQPIAFGATLNLNPLLVLVATIGFGALFGMVGLILGAPLLSAAIHISGDLGKARAALPAEERGPPDDAADDGFPVPAEPQPEGSPG